MSSEFHFLGGVFDFLPPFFILNSLSFRKTISEFSIYPLSFVKSVVFSAVCIDNKAYDQFQPVTNYNRPFCREVQILWEQNLSEIHFSDMVLEITLLNIHNVSNLRYL